MKKLVFILLGFFVLFVVTNNAVAQKSKQTEGAVVKIKTSAQCGMCKEAIENALTAMKGVKSAVLDVKTKIVTVNYKPSQTTPDLIKTAINKAGYDADDKPADAKAYQKLPNCCKKPDKK